MTQLLISVKNIEEAHLVLNNTVDLVDLKDPENGALGALSDASVRDIVRLVSGQATISATIGEHHDNVRSLVHDIRQRADLGVDIVKLAVGPLFEAADFITQVSLLRKQGVQLVAVFFADHQPDFAMFAVLKACGFYGAMLDTQSKLAALTDICTAGYLKEFVDLCHQHQLVAGLAGALKITHIDDVLAARPDYIGFRGGVCKAGLRSASLCESRLDTLGKLLLKHNRLTNKAATGLDIALHR